MFKLRFMHIPKTAGSTLTDILLRQYKGLETFTFRRGMKASTEMFNSLSEATQRRIQLFLGHAPIETRTEAANGIPIITLLRDPVDRVKSYCQHVYEGKSQSVLADYLPAGPFSLDRLLDSAKKNKDLSNLQTKMLINRSISSISDRVIRKMSPSEAEEAALASLRNHILAYGIQEYFDDSLVVFKDALDWQWPIYQPINKANDKDRLEFKDHHIERIKELNRIDVAVAKASFLEKIDSGQHRAKLSTFRKYQKFAKPVIYAKKIQRRLTRLVKS